MPDHCLKAVQLGFGDEVEITVSDGLIIIAPVKKRQRRRYSLKELVKLIPEEYKTVEIDWGEPAGREVKSFCQMFFQYWMPVFTIRFDLED
ncbi:MAG: AbrB/MazE/SpoVT family DNA-binding domain-containing protein [Desulfamplus sp.]|nr:AbrB/MazE/SpoVT family DNA-binding domain-containing protein [Desulfamplus sp.]